MWEASVQDNEGQEIAEQRLWRAVLADALQEWIHGPLRRQREAERFLFQDTEDFRTVCFSAGVDPAHLRYRLTKMLQNGNVKSAAAGSHN